MRVRVKPDGTVAVSAAMRYSAHDIEDFLKKHSVWIAREIERTKSYNVIKLQRAEISLLKARAYEMAQERLASFNNVYGYAYTTVKIGAQKSRWGSCSTRGSIRFNYKIAALPAHLRDYIIVHELCHLGAMNHSKAFWQLVARTVPDHKARRQELRNTVLLFS